MVNYYRYFKHNIYVNIIPSRDNLLFRRGLTNILFDNIIFNIFPNVLYYYRNLSGLNNLFSTPYFIYTRTLYPITKLSNSDNIVGVILSPGGHWHRNIRIYSYKITLTMPVSERTSVHSAGKWYRWKNVLVSLTGISTA